MPHTIAFIGGGNMAAGLIGGLVEHGWDPRYVRVSEPDDTRRRDLADRFGVIGLASNVDACAGSDVIVLAVKPGVVRDVCREIAGPTGDVLLISIAAGVRAQDIDRWLGGQRSVVRGMPNTPALLGSGITGLYANPRVSAASRALADEVLGAVGRTVWVEREPDLDAVTAVSGSGPAYFFLLMELMERAGRDMGLEADAVHLLVTETALGAARMAAASTDSPAELRRKVTSPGGTTQRAVEYMQNAGIGDCVPAALMAARDRADEMGRELGAVE